MEMIFFIWLIDIFNIQGAQFLDQTIHINGLFWFGYWSIVILLSIIAGSDNK